MTHLAQRRSEIETEIEGLKRERGEGKLDGRPVDGESAAILRLQIELDSLTEAEGVQADRQRDAAEAARLARVAELRSELAGLWERRLEVISMKEMCCRNAADLGNEELAINKQMLKLAHLISGGPAPTPMAPSETEMRASCRMAGVFSQLKGQSYQKFGQFAWLSIGLYRPTDEWVEKEKRLLGPHLEPLIAGAVPKVKERVLMITKEIPANVVNIDGQDQG
jgi:hypothetical protein